MSVIYKQIPTIMEAIRSLAGTDTDFYTNNVSITGWDTNEVKTNVTQPTQSAIDTELARLIVVFNGQDYARLREAKYDLLNQDEMRYDDLVNNTTTWRDGIAAIKAAHPKP